MRLSKAPRKIYAHGDVEGLRGVLREARTNGREGLRLPYRLILIVTDGVFSMDGDIARCRIVEAAEEAGAAVFVDDAHASGVLGREVADRRPLRAARARCDPGRDVVEGGRRARRLRRRFAGPPRHPRPAGPPVPVLDVAPARRRRRLPRSDRVMQDEPELLERLWSNTRRFKGELASLGFDTGVSETPITPVMMGDPDTAGPSASGCSSSACSPSRSSTRQSPSTRPGSGRS